MTFWLQWRHNRSDNVSNHQPHDCLPNRLFRRRSKRTSCVNGFCHPWVQVMAWHLDRRQTITRTNDALLTAVPLWTWIPWDINQHRRIFIPENPISKYHLQNVDLKVIEAEWRIYASVNQTIIGSDDGLSPVWHQAIIWTNVERGLLLNGPLGTL